MTVGQLRSIIEHYDDEDAVLIEYMPRPHEYIAEYAIGVRLEDDTVTIMGATELNDLQ